MGEYSLLGAIRRAGARRLSAPLSATKLASIVTRAHKGFGGPVVVFPEGTRTTGNCVLAWKDKTFEGVESLVKPAGTALISLEYSKFGAYTPHHTVGTFFKHVFWLCFQPYHTVKAVWLPASDVGAATKDKPLTE